jgi:hypothetical protein
MKQKNKDFLRQMVSNEIGYLASELGKTSTPQNRVPGMLSRMVELQEALAELVTPDESADQLAVAALEELQRSRKALKQVEEILAAGTGKGTATHTQIGRLLAIAADPAGPTITSVELLNNTADAAGAIAPGGNGRNA